MSGFTLEVHRKVYDDVRGTSVTVKPDSDALDLVEIDGGDDYGRIVLDPYMALLVAEAIKAVAMEVKAVAGDA